MTVKYVILCFDIKSNNSKILCTEPFLKSESSIYFNDFFKKIQLDFANKNLYIDISKCGNWANIYENRDFLGNGENAKDVFFRLVLTKPNCEPGVITFLQELRHKLLLPNFGLLSNQ